VAYLTKNKKINSVRFWSIGENKMPTTMPVKTPVKTPEKSPPKQDPFKSPKPSVMPEPKNVRK
jgi:hypothetical protein